MSELSVAIGVVGLCVTIMGMVGGGIWIVATVKATTGQLSSIVSELTDSIKALTARIDELEHDHRDTRERLAHLEGGKK